MYTVQANVMLTTTRANKMVAGMTLFAMTAEAINYVTGSYYLHVYMAETYIIDQILAIVFRAIVPVAILVMNLMVVREVRRRTSNAAANNLGVQHHQSTLSNSAVPTIMLITTSFVYVLLCGTSSVLYMVDDWTVSNSFSHKDVLHRHNVVAHALSFSVFAYNFYVYLITGKQFRSELHKLFSYSSSPSSSSAANSSVTYMYKA